MVQSVQTHRHITFRRPGITQQKEYNIHNTRKIWNQEPTFGSAKALRWKKLYIIIWWCGSLLPHHQIIIYSFFQHRAFAEPKVRSWFQIFLVLWMLYSFGCEMPGRLNVMCRWFWTVCTIFKSGASRKNNWEEISRVFKQIKFG